MTSVSPNASDAAVLPLPALLYHGTTARSVLKILEQGLRPRGRRKGNYADVYASNNSNVYLTTVYGPTYACRRSSKMLAVVEIDFAHLDTSLLRPDEDFLTQSVMHSLRAAEGGDRRAAVHEAMRGRLDDFQEMWRASLDGLGTVAYQGTIPPSAVTRVAVFDPRMVPAMVLAMSHTTIMVPEYVFRGQEVAAWTRWLFDGPSAVRVSDFHVALKSIEGMDDSEVPAVMREFALRQEKRLRPFLDRWDVEVWVNPNYAGGGNHAGAKGSHAETASAS